MEACGGRGALAAGGANYNLISKRSSTSNPSEPPSTTSAFKLFSGLPISCPTEANCIYLSAHSVTAGLATRDASYSYMSTATAALPPRTIGLLYRQSRRHGAAAVGASTPTTKRSRPPAVRM